MKKAIIYTIIGLLLLIFVVIPLIKFLLGYVVALTSLGFTFAILLLPVVLIVLIVRMFVKKGKKK